MRGGYGGRSRRARGRCAGGRASRWGGEYRKGDRRGLAQARRGLLSGQVTRHCERTSPAAGRHSSARRRRGTGLRRQRHEPTCAKAGKRVVSGKRGSVRVDLGGRRIIKKKQISSKMTRV